MSIFKGGLNEDLLLEKVAEDLNFEMAIRTKVDEVVREVIEEHLSLITNNIPQPTKEVATYDIADRISNYIATLRQDYEREEKEYYYLKGKGISTELNDINFEEVKKSLEEKRQMAEMLLEIFKESGHI